MTYYSIVNVYAIRRGFRESWVAFFFAAMMLFVSAAQGDQYDVLRQKWFDTIVGTGYDTNDTDVASRLTSIADTASNRWTSMNKSPARTYLWSDMTSVTDSSDVTRSYKYLRDMALAYATAGSSLYTNAALLADIVGGLDWMNTNRYNAATTQYDNWFDWEIGTPLQLTDICVLLYDQLSATQRTNYMNAVEHQTPVPDMTGANKVWKARAVGVRGCLVKDAAKLVLTRNAFSDVFPYVTSGDGFYPDGSFIQHTYHPYTAGYGDGLLANMAPVLSWLSGSTWAVTDPAQTNLYRWVFNSYQPIIYRGAAWDFVRGRGVSRDSSSPQSTGHSIMDSILQIAQFAPADDAARMKSMVKYWAQSDTVRDFVAGRGLPTLMLAKQLIADTNVTPRGELIGHYTFGSMDRVVHLGRGYGLGLSMCSSRIANFESINDENLHGWFTGDGMTVLYNTDLNQYGDSYWPTVDPYRLPGVTADPTHNKLPAQFIANDMRAQGQSTRTAYSWVGGATLGNYGAAGMQLDGWGVTLTGKKSWFMFDDEVVCLGAGITSTDSRPIETTVENRKLTSGGDNAFTVNGTAKSRTLGWTETLTNANWAHLAGNVTGADIGYYFPQPSTIKAIREARTGAWSDINEGGSTNPITRNYLRISFEHGSNPANAAYQYALLPGRAARQVADYTANPQFVVLTNTTAAQGVRETQLGITAVNFWNNTNTTVGIITCDRQASVLVQNSGTFIDVAVSDPTQTNSSTINLTINTGATVLVSADPGVTVTQISPAIQMAVAVSGAAGKTFKARFYLLTPQTVNVTPEADAYVQDGADATNNFGIGTSLVVKKGSAGYNRESFLRFNVPAYTGTLLSASLKLMPLSATDPSVHAVAQVSNNSWIESGITWSNKPTSASALSTWTPAAGVPVFANVLAAITGSGPVSLKVYATTQTANGYVTYGSRENDTSSNQPQLALSIGHTPPTITLTSPADGTLLNRTGPITLTASAQGTDGAITSVAFYDNGVLLGTDTVPEYSWNISNLSGGNHRFTAVATDSNGLTNSTIPVIVDVKNPPVAETANVISTNGVAVDVDLRTLVSDVETPTTNLLFSVGITSNGVAALLADGHTVRFTPNSGYHGPASFSYTVTDATSDDRILLNYDFQDSSATDVSGLGHNGTINVQGSGADAFPSDMPAPLALYHTQCLNLTENGTNGAVRVERLISTDELNLPNDDWTIAGWFKRNTNTNRDTIVQLGESGGSASSAMTLAFYSTADTLELRNYNVSTQDVKISKTSVAAGTWHHFAVVRNDGTLSLYVNGTLAGSDANFVFSLDNSRPLKFGGVSASYLDRWLNGRLADLAVFNGSLNSSEISQLMSRPVAYFGGQSASNSVIVNVLNNLDLWRQAGFGTITNTGEAADTSDPNGDCEANLFEFATGQDPYANTSQPSRFEQATTNFAVLYTRSKAAVDDGVQFTVEYTDNLLAPSWSSEGVSQAVYSDSGTGQVVRASIPFSGTGHRFARLKVSR